MVLKKTGVVTFEECVTRRTGPNTDSERATSADPAWTHLYLAAGAGREASINCLFQQKYKNILISYYYLRQMLKKHGGSMKEWVEANGWDLTGVRLMMDSGAYSAKTQGKPIPHEEFLAFVQKNLDYISIPIMMDTVLDPAQTEKDWAIAQASGIKFMYAFHRPEPWEFFDRNVPGAPYTGLAPMPKSAASVKLNWFGKCLHRAGARKGRFEYASPMHLLGSAAERVISKMEAVSADSSSWSMAVGVHAATRTPYGTVSWMRNPKTPKPNQFVNLKPEKQELLRGYVRKTIGLEADDLVTDATMNWNVKDSPCLPLARLNIEFMKVAEHSANMVKKLNPGIVYIPHEPDFSVCDNEQMTDVKWS